jgi:protein tyrosine phosphatase (PTP) superfamily phosphohydrolase (DUF442 family)
MLTLITDKIAIGNCEDAQDKEGIRAFGIRSILCLNGLLLGRSAESCGVEALRVFDLRDGPGNDPYVFEQAVTTVGKFAREFPNVLVHCQAGRSRSVIVVASHLMQTGGFSAGEAIDYIAQRREIALTHGIIHLLGR